MNGFLRQSTASQTRTIGPFVDSTDFSSLENALTIANTDIKIKKNGGASASKNSGGATADGAGGLYAVTWDATDTATVGELYFAAFVAGALVVFGSYVVLEEAVYDALYVASAPGYVVDQPVNTTKVGGTSQTARDLGASVLLSSGSGTGQLDFTSGVVKANVTQYNGSAATSASGRPEVNATQFAGQTITAAAGVTLPSSVASPTNITAGTITTVTNLTNAPTSGDLTATMKTSVTTAATAATPTAAAVTGAVGSVTGNVGGVSGVTFPASVASPTNITAGTITTVTNLTNAPTAGDLTATMKTSVTAAVPSAAAITTAVWAITVNGTYTALQLLRGFAASLLGKLSGAATTTVIIRDASDTKDVVTATVDANGNRSAVTLDLTP